MNISKLQQKRLKAVSLCEFCTKVWFKLVLKIKGLDRLVQRGEGDTLRIVIAVAQLKMGNPHCVAGCVKKISTAIRAEPKKRTRKSPTV